MDTPTFVSYQIDPITGSTVNDNAAAVAVIDSRFEQAEDALNDLSARIENLTTKSAIVRQHVPLGNGATTGMLVYYDTSIQAFAPAQALTLAETDESGQTIEAPQARVEGIVIGTDGGGLTTGTLLSGGYWDDASIIAACLITEPGEVVNDQNNTAAGIYYLSPTQPGRATKQTYGHLRQPVLSYYGGGKFSMSIFYMAHDNHYHASQLLSDSWTPVAGSTAYTIPGTTTTIPVPTNAKYLYTGAYDYGVGAIGDTTALFYNGELQDTISGSTVSDFVIESNNIWFRGVGAPDGNITIFNHYPFAYDTAVVRSVTSTNDAITVENTNGLITLTGNDFVSGPVVRGSYAISSISGKELTFTPIVTDVAAGPGIVVTKALDGSAYVSATPIVGGLLDAYSINHNGTTLISNGLLQYITFPAGRVSQFVMVLPVNNITAACNMYVWGMLAGAQMGSFAVTAKFIPDPTTTAVSSTGQTEYEGTLRFYTPANANASTLTYGEVLIDGCTVTGNGLLVASVSMGTAPSTQFQLLRTGFKLEALDTNTSTGGDEDMVITQEMRVGSTDISAGQAVMLSYSAVDGEAKLVPCTNVRGGLADNTNKCVGVALTDATAGSMLTYVITGTMTCVISGAVPGQSLYIGTDGMLTPVDNTNTFLSTARFLQKIGTVLTGNKIQVNIESAVQGD